MVFACVSVFIKKRISISALMMRFSSPLPIVLSRKSVKSYFAKIVFFSSSRFDCAFLALRKVYQLEYSVKRNSYVL